MNINNNILENVKKGNDFIEDIYNTYEYLQLVFYNISDYDENSLIQYLFKMEEGKWIFPSIEYKNIDTILCNIKDLQTEVDYVINGKSNYLGYMNYKKDIYLFYKVEYFNINEKVKYYFGSYHEILLSNHMYNYQINSDIKDFFKKNKNILFITTLDNENIKGSEPIVLYQNIEYIHLDHVMFFGPIRVDNKYILYHKINKENNKLMVKFLVFECNISFKDKCNEKIIFEGNKCILYNTNNVYFHSIM